MKIMMLYVYSRGKFCNRNVCIWVQTEGIFGIIGIGIGESKLIKKMKQC